MILKKPYAFLIKYFRIIHIVLSVISIYIFIKSINIYSFFNEYIKNNYSVTSYEGFSSTYVSFILFFAVSIISVILLLMVMMFENKKKPNKVYQVFLIYYLIFFILLFVTKSILSSFEVSVISAESARIYRDISIISMLPQIPFIIIIAIRALGFNVKKFEFEKDIKELQITEEDDEEFEININHDVYKFKRTVRRFFREFLYYVKENKFIFICMCVCLILLITVLIFTSTPKNYDNYYRENQNFVYGGLNINIKDSIVTNLDYNGNKIDDNYYIVLKVNVQNNTAQDIEFKSKNLRLMLNNKFVVPQFDKSIKFVDYANDFYGDTIMANTSFDYAMVYKIKKEDIKKSYKISIYRGSINEKKDVIDTYHYINIKPELITDINTESENKINDTIKFSNTGLLNTSFKIESYELTKKYNYSYDYCINKADCRSFQDFVVVNNNSKKILLALNYKFDLDNTAPYAVRYKTASKFAEDFIKIKYLDEFEEFQYADAINLTPNNLKDVLVLEVDDVIEKSKTYSIAIIIRDKEYLITLK